MMKRIMSLLLAALMTAAVFAGCSDGSSPSTSTPASEQNGESAGSDNAQQGEAPAGDVSFRFQWWGSDERHEATLEVIDTYMAANPHVFIEAEYRGKSEREKVATELAGGQLADLVQLDYDWLIDFTQMGDFFVNLYDYDEIIDMSGFDMNFARAYAEFGGELYGLPTGINARANLINVEMAQQYGLPTGLDTQWTWEEYLENGKIVNETDSDKYFLNADTVTVHAYILRPYLKQLTGNQVIQDDKSLGFTRDELIQALDYIGRLYQNNVVLPASDANVFLHNPWTNPKWINGDFVSELTISSTIPAELEDMPGTGAAFIIPQMEGAKESGITVMPSQLLGISNKTPNIEEVAKFMNYFFNSDEAGLILKDCRATPPVDRIRELCAAEGLLNPVVVDATNYGQANQGSANNRYSNAAELDTILRNACEQIAYEPANAESIADDTIKLIEDLITTLD